MKAEVQIEVQDLDHLGIIAGIVDEIGIVEVIDKEIGTDVMAERFEIETKIAHIDGTSLAVHGKYLQPEEEEIEDNPLVDLPNQQDSAPEDSRKKDEEDLEPVPISITHGYSRDHRPDLKQ